MHPPTKPLGDQLLTATTLSAAHTYAGRPLHQPNTHSGLVHPTTRRSWNGSDDDSTSRRRPVRDRATQRHRRVNSTPPNPSMLIRAGLSLRPSRGGVVGSPRRCRGRYVADRAPIGSESCDAPRTTCWLDRGRVGFPFFPHLLSPLLSTVALPLHGVYSSKQGKLAKAQHRRTVLSDPLRVFDPFRP